MAGGISDEDVKFVLEAWKTVIGVQQHFNSIEMQIRSIAITVLTAVIGAAALVYSQAQKAVWEAAQAGLPAPGYSISVLFLKVSAASVIAFGGLVAWLAFYVMDRWSYHRLLQGAVKHGQAIENKIRDCVPFGEVLGLSNAIRTESPFKLLGIFEIHSDRKIDLFYLAVALVLVILIIVLR